MDGEKSLPYHYQIPIAAYSLSLCKYNVSDFFVSTLGHKTILIVSSGNLEYFRP